MQQWVILAKVILLLTTSAFNQESVQVVLKILLNHSANVLFCYFTVNNDYYVAMPSMAAPPGDCTFDDDLCGYTVKSIRQAPYSPPLWDVVQGQPFPSFPLGHTRVPKYKLGIFYYYSTCIYCWIYN